MAVIFSHIVSDSDEFITLHIVIQEESCNITKENSYLVKSVLHYWILIKDGVCVVPLLKYVGFYEKLLLS